jgi:hypothetical protein
MVLREHAAARIALEPAVSRRIATGRGSLAYHLLYAWVNEGRTPHLAAARRALLIKRTDLDALIDANMAVVRSGPRAGDPASVARERSTPSSALGIRQAVAMSRAGPDRRPARLENRGDRHGQ